MPTAKPPLKAGMILHTKDGKTMGNAIIIRRCVDHLDHMKDYLAQTNQNLWLIETDFGNRCRLTDKEIDDQFERGPILSPALWFADRHRQQNHTWTGKLT